MRAATQTSTSSAPDPLTEQWVDSYTGAGMSYHETIGALEALSFSLKSGQMEVVDIADTNDTD